MVSKGSSGCTYSVGRFLAVPSSYVSPYIRGFLYIFLNALFFCQEEAEILSEIRN
jgi:hypothetical protein